MMSVPNATANHGKSRPAPTSAIAHSRSLAGTTNSARGHAAPAAGRDPPAETKRQHKADRTPAQQHGGDDACTGCRRRCPQRTMTRSAKNDGLAIQLTTFSADDDVDAESPVANVSPFNSDLR